jgi:hypothetical protein
MDTKTSQEINCRELYLLVEAQLKHIKQLVEYITGMDTRIGYPNEHLAAILTKNSLVHICYSRVSDEWYRE